MKRSTIFGVALISVASGVVGLVGAVVIAKAQEPESLPRYAAYPPRVAEELDPAPVGASEPIFEGLIESPPPPIAETLLPESLDSNEFINKGQSLASEAINALTAERDSLRERLEQIDQELARWNAIQKGLSSAKDATLTDGPEDELDLAPLPRPTRSSRADPRTG